MKLRLKSLADGEHIFTTQVAPTVLQTDMEQVSRPIDARVIVDKRGGNYYVKIYVSSIGRFVCDRCLTSFDLSLQGELTIIYTSDEHLWGNGEDEDIRLVPKSGDEVDLSDDFHDAIHLSIPIKHLCSEECKGLCSRCGANLNTETCSCSRETIDPRWEALKKLKS